MIFINFCMVLQLAPQDEVRLPGDEQNKAQQRRHESPNEELFRLDGLGVRTTLEERGFEVQGFNTTDVSYAFAGGLERDAKALRSLFDVSMSVTTDELFDLPGGFLFADFQLQRGEDASMEVGDLQAFSNIDAENFSRVSEFWWQHELYDSALELQAGRIDANGRFATVDNGVSFINSSMGFSPTIVGLSTYPKPTYGASARVRLADQFDVSVGVFDAEPSGSFTIVQADATWEGGRLGLGAWSHSGQFNRFDGGVSDGTSGTYLTLDQFVANGVVSSEDRMSAFLQLGRADEGISPVSKHIGFGVVLEGVGFYGEDTLGMGVSHAGLSDEPGAGFPAGRERAWELFYSFTIAEWLSLKPDLQFIQDPGGVSGVDDAWVFTLRSTFEF
ncbi:MAG: porin [Planctomycetota bacterium]|jgi:porin